MRVTEAHSGVEKQNGDAMMCIQAQRLKNFSWKTLTICVKLSHGEYLVQNTDSGV